MPSGADIGLAIQLHLGFLGWTQTYLASKAGVSDKTISAWKTGKRNPDPKLLLKVVNALGISMEDLLATADLVAKRRASLGLRLSTRAQHASSMVAEGASLRLLSDDELTLALGRAREFQLKVEGEIQARSRAG